MGNENVSIVEYLEGTNGIRYYLEDFQKDIKKKIENVQRICDVIGSNKDTIISFFSNNKEILIKGFNIHKLIAPEAIEIDCSDNCLIEIDAPKAKKILCSCNPIEKINAPNCKEIDIKITGLWIFYKNNENIPQKSNFLLDPDCKITETDMFFYKDDFYAFVISEEDGIKIEVPVYLDGSLEISEENIPLSIEKIRLETNARFIKIKNVYELKDIIAPNAMIVDCRNTRIENLDLPNARRISASNTLLRTINAPKAIWVDCDNTFVERLELPEAEEISCINCKELKDIVAPKCTKIDFTETLIKYENTFLRAERFNKLTLRSS